MLSTLPRYAEGATPSAALDDITLTLTLAGGANPLGPPQTAKLTAVEVTLDICKSRPSAGVDPSVIATPDKVNLGRNLLSQDAANHFDRAKLIIQPAKPAAFKGTLTLTAKNAHVTAFKDEKPKAGEAAALPFAIVANTIPASGAALWAQGAAPSADLRDSGFVLAIKDLEPEADKVTATSVQLTLAICQTRTKAAVDPTPLSANDKVKVGRFVHEQDAKNHHGRATLIVRQVKPKKFDGTVVLRSLPAAHTESPTSARPLARPRSPHPVRSTSRSPRTRTSGSSCRASRRAPGCATPDPFCTSRRIRRRTRIRS